MNRLLLLLRKWWFWLIVLIIISGAAGALGNALNPTAAAVPPAAGTFQPSPSIATAPEPAPIITASPAPTVKPSPVMTASPAPVPAAAPSPSPSSQAAGSPAPDASGSIQLISLTSPIGRNQTATLKIKGAPNTEYSISVYYSSGASEAKGLEPKQSDSEAYVSWSWKIGGRTKAGDYKVVIKGGGETYETSITITE